MIRDVVAEKLEAVDKSKNKKAFKNLIYEFTVDDIITLNESEFHQIIDISKKIKINDGDEFFEYLEGKGSFNLKNAMNRVNKLNSILICRFYCELYINLMRKHGKKFASVLLDNGIAYALLSDMGNNTEVNLKTAVQLFQGAQKIFPQTSPEYASAVLNEGNARRILAERGVDTGNNLKTSVQLFQEAQKIFLQTSPDYANAVLNEGTARLTLAERGVDTEHNLKTSVQLYQEAQKIFPQTSTDHAGAVMNEGTARRMLAERGVDTEHNLKTSVQLCQEAQKIFPQTSTDHASVFMNEGIARLRLAERGVDTEHNLKTSVQLCQEAQKRSPQSSIGYASAVMNEGSVRLILAERGVDTEHNLKTSVQLNQEAQKIFPQIKTSYARAVMNEGTARRILAERGVDTEHNLKTAVQLYQEAQKIFPQGSTDYAGAVMNEGSARLTLAESGVDTEDNLNNTKNLYIKSILIFENLRDFGTYSIALFNLNRFFINNYRISGDSKYLDEAKNIIEDTEVKINNHEIWDKKLILAQLHEIRASLLEFEGKPGINKASREYSKAHELTGNPFYKFMDEFCQARLDLELFCSIVHKWKEIKKTSIFLDYYNYSIFECHLEKALNNKGLSREEEFRLALRKLEEIRDITGIKVIKDRVSAHIYLMTAFINCFRKETYGAAGDNVRDAGKIFQESNDKAGQKICDIFFDAIIKNKNPEAWIEIIKHKDKLSCNIYRLLSEGADRKRAELGMQGILDGNKRIEKKLDGISDTLEVLNGKEKTGIKPVSNKKYIHILHLSDIHLTKSENSFKYRTPLEVDLRKELKIDRLEYLIISGDIVRNSTKDEYDRAFELIEGLIKRFELDSNRVVIVPGNHDVNWEKSEEAYTYVPKRKITYSLPDRRCTPAGEEGVLVRNEDRYKQRFEYFNYFYKKIYNGKEYPSNFDEQGILYPCPNDHILFLGLNSSWEIDHHYPKRASINMDSLSKALNQLVDGKYDDWLKIAIWHHPITGLEAINDDFMQQLAVNGFQICIHGHIHEAKASFYHYDKNREIHIIGAGTFDSQTKEQVSGIPLQYNLIKLDPDTFSITVETRKKEKPDGAWSGDARWDDKNNPKSHYLIKLK